MVERGHFELDKDHSLYFNFFLSELPRCFPYVSLFPWTAATLFASSNLHPALRECVLSIAALLEDRESEASRNHLQRAMGLLRTRISFLDVDESVAISSFLLAYWNLLRGDLQSTRAHLQGMLSVFKSLDPGTAYRDISVPSPEHVTPLMTLIWRMGIRVDFISSIASGGTPILPRFSRSPICAHGSPPDEEDGIRKAWIQAFADRYYSPHNAEWAEAWFQLDSLMHKVCHVGKSVKRLRQSSEADLETQISNLIKPVIQRHRRWQKKMIVGKALEIERAGELFSKQPETDTSKQTPDFLSILPSPIPITPYKPQPIDFLDHRPVHITDCFFASRLNSWRAIDLYLALIQEPQWAKTNGEAIVEAVDLCSTYAAHGGECSFLGAEKATDLYIAGIIFGGPEKYSVTISSS